MLEKEITFVFEQPEHTIRSYAVSDSFDFGSFNKRIQDKDRKFFKIANDYINLDKVIIIETNGNKD